MFVTTLYHETLSKKLVRPSFEILPPIRGNGIQNIFDHLNPLMDFEPAFINVTYHRREHKVSVRNNVKQLQNQSRRPGTVGICAAIQQHYNVDAVMHLICGGFTYEETEDALIELSYLDVQNVLALRGDGLKSDNRKFVSTRGGHQYARSLIEQIVLLNQGKYLDNADYGAKMNLCIGVAGYPERHYEAFSLDEDIAYLKEKIEAGGQYILTQMFFDNQVFYDFVDRCRRLGITAPIIPGLKPITRKKHLSILPQIFYVNIPEQLRREVEKCKDDEACAEVGVLWLKEQSKDLKANGETLIHYYTLGDPFYIRRAIKDIF